MSAIFLAMASGEPPPYPDDDFRSLLAKLRDAGQQSVVTSICETYLRDGVDPKRLGDVCEG
jgi:hypothetical protein